MKMNVTTRLIAVLFLMISNPFNAQSQSSFKFKYDLERPHKTFELPTILKEISGLGMTASGKHLVAIQDENGKLFYISKKKGEVTEKIDFYKDGDYEGVEVVGEDIYVVKSTGTIYQVINPMNPDRMDIEKYNDILEKENDVEGLGYDKKNNRLLVACKAKAGKGDDFKLKKGIYTFDLATKKMTTSPVFVISLEDVQNYLDTKPILRELERIEEFFQPNESFTFSPSAIAIHPKTGNLYITSSVGKLLLILSEEGKILHIEKMHKSIHRQPEGLCFDEEGNLYIANEGKKGEKGKVLVFKCKH